MRCSPRFCTLISSAAILTSLALALPGKSAFAADNQVVFIFGGDESQKSWARADFAQVTPPYRPPYAPPLR